MSSVKKDVKEKYDTAFSVRLRNLLNNVDGCSNQGRVVSQGELADYLGVSRQSVNSYALGTTLPRIDEIKKMAEFFNVTTDYLIGLSDNQTPEYTSIGEKTGLSDNAIGALYRNKCINNKDLIDVINYLIENEDIMTTDYLKIVDCKVNKKMTTEEEEEQEQEEEDDLTYLKNYIVDEDIEIIKKHWYKKYKNINEVPFKELVDSELYKKYGFSIFFYKNNFLLSDIVEYFNSNNKTYELYGKKDGEFVPLDKIIQDKLNLKYYAGFFESDSLIETYIMNKMKSDIMMARTRWNNKKEGDVENGKCTEEGE